MLEPRVAAFALIALASYAVQTVTGFGSTLILVALGAHLLPLPDVVALAVPISVLQSSYVALRHRSSIAWGLLLRRVLPLIGVGLAVGYLLRGQLEGVWLQLGFALLVLLLAVRGMVALLRAREERPLPKLASIAGVLGAGIVHGLYATGGPLLVYAIGRSGLDKAAFRSTLAVVWLLLDLTLCILYASEGRYDLQSALRLAIIVPAVILGVLVGEALHHRVDERRFKLLVFALLIVSAIALGLRSVVPVER